MFHFIAWKLTVPYLVNVDDGIWKASRDRGESWHKSSLVVSGTPMLGAVLYSVHSLSVYCLALS
jgi:hypothetical protein